MKQNRWRSPVLWAAIAAQLLVVLKVTGVWQLVGIPESVASDAVAAVIQLLVLVGVLNDPTSADSW